MGPQEPYQTPLGVSPYRVIFCKACHLLVEIEHHACRNLPHDGTTKQNKRGVFYKRKRVGVATNIYLREKVRKTKKKSLRILKSDFKIIYFPTSSEFFCIIFFESTRVLPLLLRIPRCNEEIRPTIVL